MAKEIDFEGFKLSELLELKTKLDDTIARKRDAEKQELLRSITELANSSGFSISDLFGGVSGGGKKGKQGDLFSGKSDKRSEVKPKYRHPTDHGLTWTGRGRKPVWVQTLLGQGKMLDDLLIQ